MKILKLIVAVLSAFTEGAKLFAVAMWFTIGGLFEFAAWKLGAVCYAIEPEIWVKYIIENLFKGNEFLNYCFKEDDYVNGTLVHLPQAGSPSSVVRNRDKLPAGITKRKDTFATYVIDEFTTNPKLVTNAESVELSYDKMSSIMMEDMTYLRQVIAEWMLYHWTTTPAIGDSPAIAAQVIRTTGDDAAATVPGATGTRKLLTKEDLRKAKLVFDNQDIPKEGRFAIIPANMMDQLLSDSDLLKRDVSGELNLEKGVITKLYGFQLIDRSTVLKYNNVATPVVKTPDAASATTDNEGVKCYQQLSVARAMGETKVFEDTDNPTYYGDIISFLKRAGGRIRRSDGKGVLSIVQAHGS